MNYKYSTFILILAVLAAALLVVSGCGYSAFAGKTKASWTMPDGKVIAYESDKETTGLEAEFNPKTGAFRVRVDKAGAQESAVAAALEQSKAALELAKEALAVGMKAATKSP